ncbi:HAMP domain-containing histidine kinase [bacterium]|nr:HAMP domain-containing histidine kinase [bacterium]
MRRFDHISIFVKLFVIWILTAVAINVTVLGALHWKRRPAHTERRFIDKNIKEYLTYLATTLRSLPGDAQRKQWLERTGFEARTTGTFHFESQAALPELDAEPHHRGRHGRIEEGLRFGRAKGRTALVLEDSSTSPPTEWIFYGPENAIPPSPFDIRAGEIVALISVLTLIIALSYILLRKTLTPIGSLSAAVEALGQGNLHHEVAVTGKDELASLARSFNGMAKNLREMVERKERMLIDISHELRSPVARAKVAAEFIADAQIKRSITEDLGEMDHMIRDLLESARLHAEQSTLELSDFEMQPLLEQAIHRYASDRKVSCQFPKNAVHVTGDRERLATVVKNLLENAVKYATAPAALEVTLEETPREILFTVRDEGPGIPVAEQERVFEPFYRLDRSRTRSTGGFGLGLSLSRRILEAHKGTLTVESAEPGARFIACLPKTKK